MADFSTICSKLCLCKRPILQGMSGGQESTQLSRPLLLLPSLYENTVSVKARSTLKLVNSTEFSYSKF